MFDTHDVEAEAINRSDDNAGMFLSIGDLMSGLLMIFALLFIVVVTAVLWINSAMEGALLGSFSGIVVFTHSS